MKKILITVNFLSLLFSMVSNLAEAQYPGLITYSFEALESKVLPGMSTEIRDDWGCDKGIMEADQFGSVAVVTEFYQNGCFTDGRYNHSNYRVEKGTIRSNNGKIEFEAYRIHEPTKKAEQFLGSPHKLYYTFPEKGNFKLLRFENGRFSQLEVISNQTITPNKPVKINSMNVSRIVGNQTLVMVPQSVNLSTFSPVGSAGMYGAQVYGDDAVTIEQTQIPVPQKPFDTSFDFSSGPGQWGNRYGTGRKFFPILKNGSLQVIWQSKSNETFSTTFKPGDKTSTTEKLVTPKGRLVAVAHKPDGTLYLLNIGDDNNPKVIMSINRNGRTSFQTILDSSRKGVNIHDFGNTNIASMIFKNDTLGLVIGRRMKASSDGLNHQGAIAVTFNAKDLSVIKNYGQTSGHSFDNILYPHEKSGFLAMDLGDNYPRGIHLHWISPLRKRSRVIYTFKTEHGGRATSPAGKRYPPYKEISKGGNQFYQWSNDNNTYTELGGVVKTASGYGVYFIGEPDANGYAIKNDRAQKGHFDSRDIGYVEVKHNFYEYDSDPILSSGISESGGFYTFGGRFSEQSNKGISWLTDYDDPETENASRLKVVQLANGRVFLFWEKWSPNDYIGTYYVEVKKGKALSAPKEIGSNVRLNRRDEPIVDGNNIWFVSGQGDAGLLNLTRISVK